MWKIGLIVLVTAAILTALPQLRTAPVKPQITARQSAASTTNSEIPDIASNSAVWQEYYNPIYGYTLMHPADWTLDTSVPTDTVLTSLDDGYDVTLRINVSNNKDGLTPEEWARRQYGFSFLPTISTTTVVDGVAAYHAGVFGGDADLDSILIPHNGEMYEITFENPDFRPKQENEFETAFRNVVDTFRFTGD
jgi:hypothetical protein